MNRYWRIMVLLAVVQVLAIGQITGGNVGNELSPTAWFFLAHWSWLALVTWFLLAPLVGAWGDPSNPR